MISPDEQQWLQSYNERAARRYVARWGAVIVALCSILWVLMNACK